MRNRVRKLRIGRGMTQEEIAERVGVSRQTIYTYLGELEAAGRIARDNGMVQVLEA